MTRVLATSKTSRVIDGRSAGAPFGHPRALARRLDTPPCWASGRSPEMSEATIAGAAAGPRR